jgi:hypothetical protein
LADTAAARWVADSAAADLAVEDSAAVDSAVGWGVAATWVAAADTAGAAGTADEGQHGASGVLYRVARAARCSVPEMSPAGQKHGHSVLVAGVDCLIVAFRTARLDHRGDTVRGGQVGAVSEGEECVGRED